MKLNQYAAERRLRIFDDLRAGRSPSEGSYDEGLLREARAKGQPQMGATRYEPEAIWLEYVFPDSRGAPAILTIRLDPPERIVFMPVPAWVVETIWQGEIDGSHQFESDAHSMVEAFARDLAPDRNPALFGRRASVGRG